MINKLLVAIDIGGTSVKIAFVDFSGEIVTKWEIPTDISNGGEKIVKDIASSIRQKVNELGLPTEVLASVGVGAPGFIDYDNGVVALAPNLGWRDYPLRDTLAKEIGLPVTLENDANVAAIGEMWKGAGRGKKNIVVVTLGTGVGGGVIVDGNIIRGVNGMGGEIGHITVDPNGYLCGCGRIGCLETVASATGMIRIAKEKLNDYPGTILSGNFTTKELFEGAQKGDALSSNVVNTTLETLALTLSNIAHTVNPELIIIGGGVSKAGDFLLTTFDKYLKKYMLPRAYQALQLKIATLGNDAGVYGSAFLAKNNQ